VLEILCAQNEMTMPIQNWNLSLSQLAIYYEGLLGGVLEI
jgi:hypothetical protein